LIYLGKGNILSCCSTCMPVISVKIDDELKRKMDKYKYINWSEIIKAEIAEALLLNEKLRRKSTKDTTKIIREWRESRCLR